jgi:hypothetical protein
MPYTDMGEGGNEPTPIANPVPGGKTEVIPTPGIIQNTQGIVIGTPAGGITGVPKGAEITEKDAQGIPTVYTAKNNNGQPERYYTPASTMYKLGFRNESEYTGIANRTGLGLHEGAYIPNDTTFITNKEGIKLARYRTGDLEAAARDNPNNIYNQAMNQGNSIREIKVQGTQTTGTRGGFTGIVLNNGERVDAAQVKGMDTEQVKYLKDNGVAAFNQRESAKAVKFAKENVQLKSGDFVSKADLAKLDSSQAQFLITNGVDAFSAKYSGKATDVAIAGAVREIDTILRGKTASQGNIDAITAALVSTKNYKGGLSGDKVVSAKEGNRLIWDSLTNDEKKTVANYYAGDLYKTSSFGEYIQLMKGAGQSGGVVTDIALSPITQGILSPAAKASSGQPVTTMEWGSGAAKTVLDVLAVGGAGALGKLGMAGRLTESAIQAGSLGVLTAASWDKMTPSERALAIGLNAAFTVLPYTGDILKAANVHVPDMNPVGKASVELSDGSKVTVWKGVKLGNQPLIGKSDGKLVFGAGKIKVPDISTLKLPGAEGAPFEPRTGLETNILTNKTVLARAGMPGEMIKRIETTLPEVRKFYGKASPYMVPDNFNKSIVSLDDNGVEAVLKTASDNNKIVDRVFGSTTMRPQIDPKDVDSWVALRGKLPADIDMQLKNVDADGAKDFTQKLVDKINAASEHKVWVSPNKPTLVMSTAPDGSYMHAVDIHYQGEPIVDGVVSPSEFQDMVYGMGKAQPTVKVNVPGVGNINISRLSETGVGKTEQVLGWRIDPATNRVVITTEAHRLKDYADLYEIIKTYSGARKADDWAGVMGLDIPSLQKLAEAAPADYAWTYTPSTVVGSAGIPSIAIVSPALLSAATSLPVAATPSGQIVSIPLVSKPIRVITSNAPTTSAVSTPSRSTPATSPSVLATRLVVSPGTASPNVKSKESPSAISPSSSTPSMVSSSVESPSVKSPSPPSPISPSVPPSSITIVPVIPPPSLDKHRPGEDKKLDDKTRKYLLSPSGKISWKQGFGWWVIKYPYASRKDASFTTRRPVDAYISSGPGSAFRTLRIIGLSPGNFILKLGVVTANISGDNITFRHNTNVKKTRRPTKKKRSTSAGISNLI